MKKITIIGSESFLARNYYKYCIKEKKEYEFYFYDMKKESEFGNGNYYQIDFTDKDSIKKIRFDVDYIIIYSGMTGTVRGFEEYSKFLFVNELLLLNILDVYVKKNSKAEIIYPSTRLIYKSQFEPVSEEGIIELKSIYAVNKFAAEQYLKIYHEVYGINYVILRICTPIGSFLDENGNYGTFEIFEKQAINGGKITVFGDGKQKKTFTYIEDICEGFCKIIDKNSHNYNVYNIGGQVATLIEIVELIAKKHEVPIEYREWPRVNLLVDGGNVIFDSFRFDDEFEMIYEKVTERI